MNTEYEVRLLDVDKEEIISKLKSLGAKFNWENLQKRYVYDFIPKEEHKWIRLRTDGKKTTLTIKNIISNGIDGAKELEIEVDDFEKTHLILKELGYTEKGYQENIRCQYMLDGVEIDIDSWPLIPTYMEIEGKNEKEVMNTLEKLDVSKEKASTKDVEKIYLDYGINLNDYKVLKFEEEK